MRGNFIIDSFTTLTPKSSFRSINPELLDKHVVMNTLTGEVKQELTLPVFVSDRYGVKYRVSMVSLFGVDYVRITWTSKMLHADYFNGLSMANFYQCFMNVMATIECDILPNDFLVDSKINDIDIAFDFVASDTDFQLILAPYRNVPSNKVYYSSPSDFMSQKRLIGLQFVNRKDASISHPFLKFYTKKEELMNRSATFWKNVLVKNSVACDDFHRRLEVTLKNSRHIEATFKRCKIPLEKSTVTSILSLPTHYLECIVSDLLSRYVPKNSQELEDDEEEVPKSIAPTDFMLGAMACELLEHGYSVKNIAGIFNDFPGNSYVAKHRIVKRMKLSIKFVRHLRNLRALTVTASDAFLQEKKSD